MSRKQPNPPPSFPKPPPPPAPPKADRRGSLAGATGSDSSGLNEVTIFGVNYDGALNNDGDDNFDYTKPCPNCCGTGAEPYDDFTTPCEECDGTGTLDE